MCHEAGIRDRGGALVLSIHTFRQLLARRRPGDEFSLTAKTGTCDRDALEAHHGAGRESISSAGTDMSVRYGVLGLLSRKDMHGYELKASFDRLTGGFWQLNFGQVYTTLDRLEREGLVERASGPSTVAVDRKVFRITLEGRSKLDEWIRLPVAQPRALRDDLFVRLLFCDRTSPAPILHMIQRQRDV